MSSSKIRVARLIGQVLLLVTPVCSPSRAAEVDLSAQRKLEAWVDSQHLTRTLTASFTQQRKLRTIERPMLTSGRMWWDREAGFRWELGDPPKLILIEDCDGRVAEIRPSRQEIELRSRQQAEEEMYGLGFGFSTFFNADPTAWENQLHLLRCEALASNPVHIVAEFKFREARLARAIWRMIIVADTEKDDLREFQIIFRDKSSITLHFEPMQKNTLIDPARFEINLDGYAVKRN